MVVDASNAALNSQAVPRGSRLVYNTGRALHKCIALFEEKRGVLPPPDCLITSVGTKVGLVSDRQVHGTHIGADDSLQGRVV